MLSVIVAVNRDNYNIGINGDLPWLRRIPEDMKFFKSISLFKPVIMGRKTMESIPKRFYPLPDRLNIVISRTLEKYDNTIIFNDFNKAVDWLISFKFTEIMVIGGEEIYKLALNHKLCKCVYVTYVDPKLCKESHDGDKFFPHDMIPKSFVKEQLHVYDDISIVKYICLDINNEEMQYIDLVKRIIKDGYRTSNRTGVDTLTVYGNTMEFSLHDGTIPLLTTKKMAWKSVVIELLWFISGSTNTKFLLDNDVHIWDGNTTREFLDSRGLFDLNVGDVGPSYGYQWRFHNDEQPIDQLQNCIDQIINDPESRRIIMTAWNPKMIDKMALPPCHILCQFHVNTVLNELNCHIYQRSADVGLGIPFNIASYSLLVHLICGIVNINPGKLIYTTSNTHIYTNHIDGLLEQIMRDPYKFPKVKINTQKKIDDYKYDDIELIEYNYYNQIKLIMC